jgi:hypothetical protein
MRHRLGPLLAAALLAGPASAQVALVEAGIVCPREVTGALREAPGTEAGVIRDLDQATEFDLTTRVVPTMPDISFGFRVGATGGAGEVVSIVVTHPPMGERGVTRQEWTTVLAPGTTALNLFTFEEAYEMVPGPWAFAVEAGGERMAEARFEVTEAPVPTVEAMCLAVFS